MIAHVRLKRLTDTAMANVDTQNGVPATANNVRTGHAKDGPSSSPGLAPPAYTAIDENHNQPNEAQVLEQSRDAREAEADITWAFTKLQIKSSTDGFPTPETSLAHLKLLEAFYSLKDEVAYTDGAFGLFDSRAPGTEESVAGDMEATKKRLGALAQIREKRWALYFVRAVDRFEVWWTKVLVPRDIAHAERLDPKLRVGRLTTTEIEDLRCWDNFVNNPTVAQQKWQWTRDMLPPLGKFAIFASMLEIADEPQMCSWSGILSCSTHATILRTACALAFKILGMPGCLGKLLTTLSMITSTMRRLTRRKSHGLQRLIVHGTT